MQSHTTTTPLNSLPERAQRTAYAAPWIPLFLLALSGCADDQNTEPPQDDIDTGETREPEASSGDAGNDAGSAATLFGVGTLTYGEDNMANAYLLLLSELDRAGAELELETAREFAGQSDFATHAGALLVANGDDPSVTRFTVSEAGGLEEEETVSFASYGIASAAFWNNQFVAEDKAYMVNGPTELIVWNPATMELEGTIELPEQEEREGLRLVVGLADRSSVVHDGKFYIPVYWTDDNYAERSDDSVVIVVDTKTDEVVDTIAVDCPGLDYATVDEAGKLHFSNWTGGVGTHYVLGTAQNCIATIDPSTNDVSTKTFASITGGHEGAAFKYAGGGRFVLSVFDEEKADIENAEDPFTPIGGLNWRLWSYDPESESAAPIESVDWNSGATIHTWANGTLYSMVPGADYASTVVYALVDAERAEKSFGITGWSFRLLDIHAED